MKGPAQLQNRSAPVRPDRAPQLPWRRRERPLRLGVPIARHAMAVELGVDGHIPGNITLGVTCTGQIAAEAKGHGSNANPVHRF